MNQSIIIDAFQDSKCWQWSFREYKYVCSVFFNYMSKIKFRSLEYTVLVTVLPHTTNFYKAREDLLVLEFSTDPLILKRWWRWSRTTMGHGDDGHGEWGEPLINTRQKGKKTRPRGRRPVDDGRRCTRRQKRRQWVDCRNSKPMMFVGLKVVGPDPKEKKKKKKKCHVHPMPRLLIYT